MHCQAEAWVHAKTYWCAFRPLIPQVKVRDNLRTSLSGSMPELSNSEYEAPVCWNALAVNDFSHSGSNTASFYHWRMAHEPIALQKDGI